MNDFRIVFPLKKNLSDTLVGIASTTSVDRDDEKMSTEALKKMVNDIKTKGVNLFENHEHGWANTLGVINDASLIDGKVHINISLDDPTTNPKIPMLLNKLARGIKLGLSVGGNVTSVKYEYDRTVGKKIKILDDVSIYEVSIVGIPSNTESFLTIPQAIAKSAKLKEPAIVKCPLCFSEVEKGACNLCLTKF